MSAGRDRQRLFPHVLPRGPAAALFRLLTAILVWSGVCEESVHAQDETVSDGGDETEALIREALSRRRAGDTEGAIAILLDASAEDPNGRVLAQLGFAYQEFGRWDLAYERLAASLGTSHPWVEEHRDAIRESRDRARERVALLEVECRLPEEHVAEIRIDGEGRAHCGSDTPIALQAGVVQLEVLGPGLLPQMRTLTSVGGGTLREVVHLHPEPSTVPPDPGDVSGDPQDPGDDPSRLPPTTGSSSIAPGKVWAIALTSTGIALGVTAGVLFRYAERSRQTYNGDACNEGGSRVGCRTDRDRALRRRNASAGTLAAGGVVVATGLGIWLRELLRSEPEDESEATSEAHASPEVRGRCVPGILAVACEVAF